MSTCQCGPVLLGANGQLVCSFSQNELELLGRYVVGTACAPDTRSVAKCLLRSRKPFLQRARSALTICQYLGVRGLEKRLSFIGGIKKNSQGKSAGGTWIGHVSVLADTIQATEIGPGLFAKNVGPMPTQPIGWQNLLRQIAEESAFSPLGASQAVAATTFLNHRSQRSTADRTRPVAPVFDQSGISLKSIGHCWTRETTSNSRLSVHHHVNGTTIKRCSIEMPQRRLVFDAPVHIWQMVNPPPVTQISSVPIPLNTSHAGRRPRYLQARFS